MHDPIIKVAIVDDHPIVRSSLRLFLGSQPDLRLVGEAHSGRAAIELVGRAAIDVLLLDLSMPGQNGIDAMPHLRAKAPGMGILVLSAYPAEHFAAYALRNGADAYLGKECPPSEIVLAVRAVARRRGPAQAAARRLATSSPANEPRALAAHDKLAAREFQVFLKLAQGYSTPDIAQQLSLATKTITTYRARVLRKLGMSSNHELTYYALKNNLMP